MYKNKDLIDGHELKDFIFEISGVFFPVNPSWKKISVSVSGGADSALLSFLICKKISDLKLDIEIHVISNIRMWKTRPWQRYNSLDVFEWLRNKFPSLKFFRHENFISPEIEYGNIGPIIKDSYGNMKSGDQISTRSFAEYVCFTNDIDAWFAGITKNPSEDFSKEGMSDRNVETLEDLNLTIVKHHNMWVCHPFKFTTKDWIIDQYIKNNILDLLEITRSCEGEFEFLNYKNYVHGKSIVPICEKCFWCKERQWAIEKCSK
jgi:hypothetical protein